MASVKNIAIRVDASSQIGTGHFMRCLTLAEELKKKGSYIKFICRHLPDYLQSMLVEKEIDFSRLNYPNNEFNLDELDHSNWLGVSQFLDSQDTIHALTDRSWDWLVVDHYALDYRWENELKVVVKSILVIDDLADRTHNCDILLDQNYYSDMGTRYNGKIPKHCQILLGPMHALLREEFRQIRSHVKIRNHKLSNILIFFGGVDVENFTGLTIDALSNSAFAGLRINVVLGAQHPYLDEIKLLCLKNGYICHIQTKQMAELMLGAELAIGAGGSATWERCCMGLPALIVSLANNQKRIAQGIDILQAGKFLDGKAKDVINEIVELVQFYSNNQDDLEMLSKNAYAATDGMGVIRLGNLLLN